MKLFHSLWTKPSGKYLLDSLWFYGLSLAYLKRLGVEVNLHADSLSAKLLKGLPYSEVKLTLDNIPEDFPTLHWAAGKFYAQQAEELGNIHIDGDVFIKKQECLDRFYTDKDIIVQSSEDNWSQSIEINYMTDMFQKAGVPVRCKSSGLNCGVIGFNNAKVKEQYIKDYFESVYKLQAYLQEHPDCFSYFCTPDLIAEQRHLFELTKDGYSYHSILEGFTYDNICSNAKKLGYLHLLTINKYTHTETIKKYLKQLNISIYNQIQENITNYNNNECI